MSITRDEGQQRVHVQSATAAESAVVIQVGGDLYLSDAGLSTIWSPGTAAAGDCPYPGLDAFGPGQAQWFFGRTNVTGELLRHLDEMTRGGRSGPLLVVGPSGVGKSSLLGAGLVASIAAGRLPARESASWPRVMLTPGPHPMQTLRTALVTLGRTLETGARIILVVDQLEEIFTVCDDEAERSAFLDALAAMSADGGPAPAGGAPAGGSPAIGGPPQDGSGYPATQPATILAGAGTGTTIPAGGVSGAGPSAIRGAIVVLGMRADFFERATAYPVLRRAMQSRPVVLGAMSAAEVREAIGGPAQAVGLALEAGFTERLLRDLGVGDTAGSAGGGYEPGRLPLLAHALRATWQYREDNRLTIAGYEATGGIGGAIARTAEDVYGRLDEAGQAAARQMFLSLVRVGDAREGDGEGSADTRRRVAADSLLGAVPDPAVARATLDAFTSARLLTSGGQAVQITHEALLGRWPRLRGWLDEDRSGHLIRQGIEDAAESWDRGGRDASGLYGGLRLEQVRAWAADTFHPRELTGVARDFLAASERRRRRGIRRRNGIIAALAALSLVLAGLSAFALNQRSVAQTQRASAQANYRNAEAGLLAAESGQAWSDFRPDTAQKFAVEAEHLDPSSPQVRSAVLAAQSLPITGRLLVNGAPDSGDMMSVAFNPAGTVIAGTTNTGYVRLWSASTHRLLWSFGFPNTGGKADDVAFSPGGQIMAVTQPGSIWLWDVANPSHPVQEGKLTQFTTKFQTLRLAFSHDGRTLAASSYDISTGAGGVVLWNMTTGSIEGAIPTVGATDHLAFTPDGKTLITGSQTGAVDLWNVSTRKQIAVVQPASTAANSTADDAIAVSPDGKMLAFDSGNPTTTESIKLWNMATRQVTATLDGTDVAGAFALAFSPDSAQLAAAEINGAVRLWQVLGAVKSPVLLTTMSGHRYMVADLAYSPNGRTLASASYDGTIALWDTSGPLLGGVANPSLAVTFSPDGKTIAISTAIPAHDVIALYSLPSRKLRGVLPVNSTAALAFSPDGKTLAVAPNNAVAPGKEPGDPVELWSMASLKLTGTIETGLTSRINSIAFSPDGTLLATSGLQDATMQVWSTARLTRVAAFSDRQQSDYPAAFGGGVFQLAFSPDGKLLTTVGIDGYIRVYGVPEFSLLDVIQPPTGTFSLAISPNGHSMAFGNTDGNVYLYAVPATGSLSNRITYRGVFGASSQTIASLKFLSNATLLAAGYDGVARFWTVPADNNFSVNIPAQTIATHAGQIDAMSYSAPLQLLATASTDGTRVWNTSPATAAAAMCRTLQAPVSRTQWKEYLPAIPYNPVC